MKILVTGSVGLIGSAICSVLQEQGFDIVSMDIRVLPSGNKTIFFGDILNSSDLSRGVQGVEGVIHLAAVSRVIDAQREPKRCLEVNVTGLNKLIETVRSQPRPPWIIYSSSREVYGEPKYLPVDERHPLNPINIYGNSKKTAENMLSSAPCSGITSIIFRLSSVYGSIHDYPTRVVPAFLAGAINGTPVRVDCPESIFDFTYVRDVAEATVIAMKAIMSGKVDGTEIFNLSPGKGTSLVALVDLLREITGKEVTTIRGEKRSYDVVQYVGNCDKLEARLGYRCQTQLREGLKLMYEDYLNSKRV